MWKALRRLALGVAACSLVILSVGAVHVWRVAGPDAWNPADAFTPDDLWRFYELPDLAKSAARGGEFERATEHAEELLALAERYPNNWNHGNALHDAHVALGLAALGQGDRSRAAEHLRLAGETPGSPQLDTFGPNMLLAEALVREGETDAVLAYFELCRRFWEMDDGWLDRWSAAVREGAVPSFRANLEY